MERERSYIPTKAQLDKWRFEIEEAIERAIKRGFLDLVVFWQKPDSIVLRIVKNTEGESRHFVEAVPRTAMTIEEIDEPDMPWEMIVNAPSVNLSEASKELPTFLHFFYPPAAELPIYIYRSRQDFRQKKPAAIVQFENDLVTVKMAA